MNRFSIGMFALVALLAALPAQGQVFKCVVNGKATYQDGPCASGTERPVDATPAASGITGLRQDADRMAAREAQEARERATAEAQRKKFDVRKFNEGWARAILRPKKD